MSIECTPLICVELNGALQNVPVSSLDQYIQWTDLPEELRFREVYMLKGTQTIVKDSTHILKRNVVPLGTAQGKLC